MFAGLTAWFSSSVSRSKKKLWVEHGGTDRSVDEAQFIFSQNAASPDTLRVFESEAYLDEHLSVFHPNYIAQCVKKGDRSQAVLGKYYFPPADVQEIARKQMQYEWDIDGNLSNHSSDDEETENRTPHKQTDTKTTLSKNQKGSTQKNRTTAGPSQTSGPSQTAGPSQSSTSKDISGVHRKSPRLVISNNAGNSSRKVQHSAQKTVAMEITSQNKHQDDDTSKQQTAPTKTHGSGTKQKYMSKTAQQNTAFDRLESLAFVSGELQDFIVGQNGCDLVKVS